MNYEKLTNDLLTAKEKAKRFSLIDDNGTCNFDTCVLCAKNLNFAKLNNAVNSAGLNVSKWEPGVYHIFGYECGQANRRTMMVEEFTKYLSTLGYIVHVHYAMD